jgi:hypothetical protein
MGKPNPLGAQVVLVGVLDSGQERGVPSHFRARPVETLTHPPSQAGAPPMVAQGAWGNSVERRPEIETYLHTRSPRSPERNTRRIELGKGLGIRVRPGATGLCP